MLELSANIEYMFLDREFVDRIDAVAELDVPAFEFGVWLEHDLPTIAERTRRYGLTVANISVDPKIRLLDSDESAALAGAVRATCDTARQLGCTQLGLLVEEVKHEPGRPWFDYQRSDRERDERRRQRDNIVRALKSVAPIAEGAGMLLLVECLNTLVDHADYFIASWQEGVSIAREVDSPALGLTFDAYHHQVNEGNLISSLTQDIDLVHHIHIADVPGRHEPGTGEINYLNLLRAAKRAGYSGYLGLECVPTKADVGAALAPIRQIVDQVNRED
ncbi:MAG: TIM barrel protein [Caldilineaceae bacterium]|nr:TIM barrel protein [Caldilineaceae bacterium]